MKELADKIDKLFFAEEDICAYTHDNDLRCYYNELRAEYRKLAFNSLYALCDAASSYNAHKSRKKDPYIAGGVAQGIAGGGAGVYTALKTEEKNKKIDEWRKNSSENYKKSKLEEQNSQKKCSELANIIFKKINSDEKLLEIYNESLVKYEGKKQEKIKENEEIIKANKRYENKEKLAGSVALIAFVVGYLITSSIIIGLIGGIATYIVMVFILKI